MRLAFLGKETYSDQSPTLFATDRGTYVVQGWRVPDRPEGVEIPQRLLAHLEPRTYLGAPLEVTGRGTFIVPGRPVTDPDTLSQMDIPAHETCVEVTKEKAVWFGGILVR